MWHEQNSNTTAWTPRRSKSNYLARAAGRRSARRDAAIVPAPGTASRSHRSLPAPSPASPGTQHQHISSCKKRVVRWFGVIGKTPAVVFVRFSSDSTRRDPPPPPPPGGSRAVWPAECHTPVRHATSSSRRPSSSAACGGRTAATGLARSDPRTGRPPELKVSMPAQTKHPRLVC